MHEGLYIAMQELLKVKGEICLHSENTGNTRSSNTSVLLTLLASELNTSVLLTLLASELVRQLNEIHSGACTLLTFTSQNDYEIAYRAGGENVDMKHPLDYSTKA